MTICNRRVYLKLLLTQNVEERNLENYNLLKYKVDKYVRHVKIVNVVSPVKTTTEFKGKICVKYFLCRSLRCHLTTIKTLAKWTPMCA